MFSLMNSFRQKVGKDKDARMSQEAVFDVSYATGFLGFDFLNGTVIHVKTPEKKFKYNSINYVDGAYTYVLGNEVGIINLEGKQVYSYKLTDSDDKIIRVSSSKVNSDKNTRYAVVTINSSSS